MLGNGYFAGCFTTADGVCCTPDPDSFSFSVTPHCPSIAASAAARQKSSHTLFHSWIHSFITVVCTHILTHFACCRAVFRQEFWVCFNSRFPLSFSPFHLYFFPSLKVRVCVPQSGGSVGSCVGGDRRERERVQTAKRNCSFKKCSRKGKDAEREK